MLSFVYPPAVYGFFALLPQLGLVPEEGERIRILDLGAGGSRPPMALFAEHGYAAVGVDIDPERVDLARRAGEDRALDLNICAGDMCALPFQDHSFHAAYEFYSMCHLSRADHALAIGEMMRVLKPGGVCFLGFMGRDSWPLFGLEAGCGEIVFNEGGKDVLHSIFVEDEPDAFFSAWEILRKETVVQRRLHNWRVTSREEWEAMYDPERIAMSREAWLETYEERMERVNYTHYFYTIRRLDGS